MRSALAPLALVLAAVLSMGAASDPAERLADPAKEARARELFKELRCVVCQNESIDDSHADLAADMRRIVREKVAAGESDAQIRNYFIGVYDDFVLLRPTWSAKNAVLWTAPFLVVLAGLGVLVIQRRRSVGEAEPPLSAQEAEDLARLREG